MDIAVLGTSVHTAPVSVRERVAFRAEDIPGVLARARQAVAGSELFLLATCNRTEWYVAGPAAGWRQPRLLAALLARADLAARDGQRWFYLHRGRIAVEHLVQVAAGLDSMVLGETEVFAQIKRAYSLARQSGTVGPVLEPLLQQAFGLAKRVRAETAISVGRVSVASVAVDLAEQVFGDLTARRVLVVGAGENSREVMRHLVKRGIREVRVTNRSPNRAEALAAAHGATPVPYETLAACLSQIDILISSTAAPAPVLRAAVVRRAVARRHGRPLLLIDLAVPRDIDPDAGDLPNVHLYNIDDLGRLAAVNLARRQAAADQARALIHAEVAAWDATPRSGELAGLMRALDELADRIAKAELARVFRKAGVAPDEALCRACRARIRQMLQRALNKMLAGPRKALHEAAHNGAWAQYAATVRHLFDLGKDDGHGSQ